MNKNIYKKISILYAILSICMVLLSMIVYEPSGNSGLTLIILHLFRMYYSIITNPIFLLLVVIGSGIYISKNEEKETNIVSLINIFVISLIYGLALRNVFTTGGFYGTSLIIEDKATTIVDKTGNILLIGFIILIIEFVGYLGVDKLIENKNKEVE